MRLIDAEPLEEILRLRCAQCSDDYGSLAGAANGCLKLVQSQPAITLPPNVPLALTDLRKMDGLPIWDKALKTWGLVVGDSILYRNGEKLPICGNMYFCCAPENGA